MRDDRNLGSVGNAHSPSAKRRRGRRHHKSSSQSNSNETCTCIAASETSSQLVFRIRKSQRETRRQRPKSASSTEGSGKSLITSLFTYETSNSYLPSNKIKPFYQEQTSFCQGKATFRKFEEKDSKKVNQNPLESNRFNQTREKTSKNLSSRETNSVDQNPLKSDHGSSLTDQNFEEAKVSDILKSVIAKEYKPIPARPSNPLRYKTELCRAHDEGGFCRFGIFCTFAHGPEELRAIPRHHKYKTELCRSYHSIGYCQYGARCHFVHDQEDGNTLKTNTTASPLAQYDCFGSSVHSLLESIGIKHNLTEKEVPVNFHDLSDLQDKENECKEMEFDFPSIPELNLSPVEKPPSFMDFLMQSNKDEKQEKTAEVSAVKSDQYFAAINRLFEPLDACISSKHVSSAEWSSSALSTSPLDESWWKDLPSLPKLNLLQSDEPPAKKSTFSSFFPSLDEKESTLTSSLSSPLAEVVMTDLKDPVSSHKKDIIAES